MSRNCSVCSHRFAAAIDRRLLADDSVAAIAKAYGVSRQALMRHRDNHTRRAIALADSRPGPIADMLDGVTTLGELLIALRRKAAEWQAKAERIGDIRAGLMAIREMNRIAETAIRATAMMSDDPLTSAPRSTETVVVILPDNGRDRLNYETPIYGDEHSPDKEGG